ncbi:DUF3307 domain-containing protein [Aquimarina sp. MMG016]|uniref:DUF3307 domain-containing protein n=1 Tax=Aquimarina sp. MMG016 TaxID=2822690 RepID=UPI001B39EDF2|nr:DUF3307 domain-containing protein [Aquimarina sp. MMG016]MBQ4819256.1 DUF3307 domain-containing protein [Aquimarina sp. MMG016]
MIFSLILIAHWGGDFVFQTSKMAIRKSYKLKWLLLHVLAYTTVLLVFSLFLFSLKIAIMYTLINAILHGVTDFFTSKLTTKYRKTPRVFYPILGLDQLIHTITLYLTFIHKDSLVLFL